ncbi:Rha family transcriptional regulator [Bilophila wadsworthia]|uniref:Rha family transcriptional regulator n=1 Tax=Bilophila wadsworthia TaxID=35833 RepID=UPI00267002B5|nr:Rha family transcriptional regulator [Bilophila wadsworthia]
MSQALLLSDTIPSVSLHDGRPATTSLEVARFFGKQHQHVIRDITGLTDNCPESFSASNFGRASYLDEQAKNRPMYIIHRDGFMLLVMGYTGKKALALKLAYIEAFNHMEAEIAKRNRPALPAAPRFDEAAMLELAAEIREAQQQYYRTYGRLCSRLITMSIPVFTALESRVYKQAPDRPFSGVRIGAQWERYFTERMTAALHSLDDRLPDEKNPAMLLLEYARAMSAR